MQKIQLEKLELKGESRIDYEFFRYSSLTVEHQEVLVVKFSGDCGYGCESNDDALYMSAIIAAGFKAWSPSALLLDLAELKYQWGDMMCMIFCPPTDILNADGSFYDYPVAAVISEKNEIGFTSLVEEEMMLKKNDLLFESTDEAANAIDCQLVEERSKES